MPFADPVENLKNLNIREGFKIADFGTGSGFYALGLARRVGDSGTVYAIDVQKELLEKLRNRGKEERLKNLQFIWADLDTVGGTKLADSSLDAVVISNILFQSEEKENMAREAQRILKSGGEVLVIDWVGRYDVGEAEALFAKVGFAPVKKFDAGEHHWGLLLKKL